MKRKPVGWCAALGLAMFSAGCAATQAKVAAIPPAPVRQPDPPAMIFPQTALELPDPQPVPPEAIPKRDLPVQPVVVETPPVRTPPRRPASTGVVKPRETEPAETVTSTETKPPSSRTPLIPIDANLPSSDKIQKRIDAVKGILASKAGREDEMVRGRIQYFIEQAVKALERKDMRQADSLASRAEVLAEDLRNVR